MDILKTLNDPGYKARQLLNDEKIIQNVKWPSIENFTPKLGQEAIEAYIKTWALPKMWLHNTTQIDTNEQEFKTIYKYDVKFSIPTQRRPIPRATASVYFFLCVWKIKPKQNPVEVTFQVQSYRLIHKPETTVFHERWLKNLLTYQTSLMDECLF